MFPRTVDPGGGSVHSVAVLRRLRRDFGGGGLPAQARASLGLEAGERVLAHARTSDGAYLVATDRALHLPSGRRVGWEHVEHAHWQRGGVHVREVATLGEAPREHNVAVPEPENLPEVVRDRVTASIVINQYLRLEGQRGVRIVGRRGLGSDEIVWNLIFDAGLDTRDPALRARAGELLTEVRRQTGL